ncbi:protein of unknown function [Acidithiobacillus ferrivorans]|uniref:Uncharacterized protein n=1 Tax=Acidithiobacillus ferrivorans TaxID=160808 RepID=A0ABY1MLY1_9PROT|nr:protein of unknown function [Acidithiobacillus ferrivorans]
MPAWPQDTIGPTWDYARLSEWVGRGCRFIAKWKMPWLTGRRVFLHVDWSALAGCWR